MASKKTTPKTYKNELQQLKKYCKRPNKELDNTMRILEIAVEVTERIVELENKVKELEKNK